MLDLGKPKIWLCGQRIPYIGSPCVHGEHCWTPFGRESLDPAAIFERVAAEEGVEVDEGLKAGAVGTVCQTDRAGAFDEGDLVARAVRTVGRTNSSR